MYFEIKPGTKPSVNDSTSHSDERPLHENYSIPTNNQNRDNQNTTNNGNDEKH